MPFAALIPLIAAAATAIGGAVTARKQAKENRKLAEYQNDANQKLLQQQLEYDKPANQMLRFQEAGLNPNLVYGQGTPGNQSTPLRYPDIKTTDYSKLMEAVPVFNQTRLTDSQVQAQDAATRQKYAMTELNRLQARVLEKNPLLDDSGFKAIIDGLKATAEIKGIETRMKTSQLGVQEASAGWQVSKIANEVKLLESQFNLGSADLRLKAEVLKSKEFQNAILEVQKKFMADGEVGPQQILQFINLLLLKLL